MQTIAAIIKNLRLSAETGSCASDSVAQDVPVTCGTFGFDGSLNLNPEFRKRWFKMDERHQEIKVMCEATEAWVRRFLTANRDKRTLVIYGRTGTGKSMVSRAALKTIGAIGISAWSEGFRNKCPQSSVSFEWSALSAIGPADRNEGTIWIDAIEAEVLALQDIGTEVDRFKSGASIENLRLILEAKQNKWTIITTNIPAENWKEAWDIRVDRRLKTNSEIVSVRNAPTYQI